MVEIIRDRKHGWYDLPHGWDDLWKEHEYFNLAEGSYSCCHSNTMPVRFSVRRRVACSLTSHQRTVFLPWSVPHYPAVTACQQHPSTQRGIYPWPSSHINHPVSVWIRDHAGSEIENDSGWPTSNRHQKTTEWVIESILQKKFLCISFFIVLF